MRSMTTSILTIAPSHYWIAKDTPSPMKMIIKNPSALEDIVAWDFAFADGIAVADGLHEVREAMSTIKHAS